MGPIWDASIRVVAAYNRYRWAVEHCITDEYLTPYLSVLLEQIEELKDVVGGGDRNGQEEDQKKKHSE